MYVVELYWGWLVVGWGDLNLWLFVVGFALVVYGGNWIGWVFIGDWFGDWIFVALYWVGFAVFVMSIDVVDG